jgi:plasmid stabilization system protein ParE
VIIPCVVLPSADRDLDLQADYLANEAGVETALRFLAAAQETFS